jgi:protein-S-isoprenylcysteine O-methyltransferase Ste14
VTALAKVVLTGLVQLAAIGVLLFGAAGTVDYGQAWVLLAVFAVSALFPSIYLQLTNPVAMQRRMRSGPTAEARPVQKLVMAGLYLALAGMGVLGGLDRRFGWSATPPMLCLAGAALVGAGLIVVVLVVAQNSYASTTVQVEADQRVVSTGLYGWVRHPMYTGNAIMLLGLPWAVGSPWALILVVPGLLVLGWRIHDEETLLAAELTGYREYTRQVRSRLLPYLW